MLLLLVYLIINIVIAELLEHSRYDLRRATVMHSVAFSFVFILLLFAQSGAMNEVYCRIFEEPIYITMRDVIIAGAGELASPLAVVGMIVPLLVAVVAVIFAVKAVKYVIEKIAKANVRRAKYKIERVTVSDQTRVVNKLYLINCVMRC